MIRWVYPTTQLQPAPRQDRCPKTQNRTEANIGTRQSIAPEDTMEQGIAMMAIRRETFPRNQNSGSTTCGQGLAHSRSSEPVKISDLQPYYRQYLQNGVLRSDVNDFYTKTRYCPSKVWVLDVRTNYVRETGSTETTSNKHGPFSTQAKLNDFLISSAREIFSLLRGGGGLTRIFVVEGASVWSAGIIGKEMRIPIDFFRETLSGEHITIPRDHRAGYGTFTMDNYLVRPRPDSRDQQRALHFESLGNNEIKVVRSHVYVKEPDPYRGTQAVVICNDGVEYGARLINRYRNRDRYQRLTKSAHWLAWDVFNELNEWAAILGKAAEELRHKEAMANTPDLELAQALHRYTAILIELQEGIRLQKEIQRLKFSPASYDQSDSEDLMERIGNQADVFSGHTMVLSVLAEQTKNLKEQVFNTMSFQQTLSIGRLTWVTVIFLPLSFVAALFSMNVKELNDAPGTWVYVVCALTLLAATFGAIVSLKHRPRGWLSWLRNKPTRDGYTRLETLEEEEVVGASPVAETEEFNRVLSRRVTTANVAHNHTRDHDRIISAQRLLLERFQVVFAQDNKDRGYRVELSRENIIYNYDLALYSRQRQLLVIGLDDEDYARTNLQLCPPDSSTVLLWKLEYENGLYENGHADSIVWGISKRGTPAGSGPQSTRSHPDDRVCQKISRKLVSKQAVRLREYDFEERPEAMIIHKILDDDDIDDLIAPSARLRAGRGRKPDFSSSISHTHNPSYGGPKHPRKPLGVHARTIGPVGPGPSKDRPPPVKSAMMNSNRELLEMPTPMRLGGETMDTPRLDEDFREALHSTNVEEVHSTNVEEENVPIPHKYSLLEDEYGTEDPISNQPKHLKENTSFRCYLSEHPLRYLIPAGSVDTIDKVFTVLQCLIHHGEKLFPDNIRSLVDAGEFTVFVCGNRLLDIRCWDEVFSNELLLRRQQRNSPLISIAIVAKGIQIRWVSRHTQSGYPSRPASTSYQPIPDNRDVVTSSHQPPSTSEVEPSCIGSKNMLLNFPADVFVVSAHTCTTFTQLLEIIELALRKLQLGFSNPEMIVAGLRNGIHHVRMDGRIILPAFWTSVVSNELMLGPADTDDLPIVEVVERLVPSKELFVFESDSSSEYDNEESSTSVPSPISQAPASTLFTTGEARTHSPLPVCHSRLLRRSESTPELRPGHVNPRPKFLSFRHASTDPPKLDYIASVEIHQMSPSPGLTPRPISLNTPFPYFYESESRPSLSSPQLRSLGSKQHSSGRSEYSAHPMIGGGIAALPRAQETGSKRVQFEWRSSTAGYG